MDEREKLMEERARLTANGLYMWALTSGPEPKIYKLISETEHPHKAELVAYLKRGKEFAAIPGIFRDFFTGEYIRGEELLLYDGVHVWSSDVPYYVEKYNLQLPEEFVQYILDQKKKK